MSVIVKYKSLWFDTLKECSYFVLSVNAGRFNEKLMYCGKYAPWDHYPKNLRISEVLNPMSVVMEFFSSDRVTGHSERLKEWRDFVIDEENYYNHKSHGPGMLVFICEQNLQLLEAMYLLLLKYQDDWRKPKDVSADQLSTEKEQWEYFPNDLSTEELQQPYYVVETVFSKINPQQYRDYLNEWLYYALTNSSNDESIQAAEIISVYENINKLYSAAWVIHQRDTTKTIFKNEYRREKEDTVKPAAIVDTVTNAAKAETELLIRALTPADKLGLKEVTSFILKKEPLVKAIFHLGTLQNPFTYFLYILIDEKKFYLNYDINQQIENFSKSLVPLFVMIDSANLPQNTVSEGQRFFDYVLENGSIMYQSNDLVIPKLQCELREILNADLNEIWQWWKSQSQAFYKIAKYSCDNNEYNMALYFSHQSLEMSLLGLLEVKTGFKTTIPNFQRLIMMTLLFTDRINKFFETLAIEDGELHHLLWNVHPIEARRRLIINEYHIKRLILKACDLFDVIEELLNEDI